MISILDFFLDPVLRGPTWGTLLMCISSSLMGVVLFFKRRSLLSESLSHAAYPGIILAAACIGALFPNLGQGAFFIILGGAFFSSFFGLKIIEWMEKKRNIGSDTALCFVLALFFGAGTVAASALQMKFPIWHQKAQTLLFGQAATMTDFHIALYALLTLAVVTALSFGFRPLQALLFDPGFAKSARLRIVMLERIVFWLLLLSLVLGIRSVGVLLMSGMAIAPAIAARQWSDRLQMVFVLAALFGAISGLAGNIFSVMGTLALSTPQEKLALPTGPAIILTSSLIALISLLFAPKRGWIFCLGRMIAFRIRCVEENVLKYLWKKGATTGRAIQEAHGLGSIGFFFVFWRLQRGGWLEKRHRTYVLSEDGQKKAASIVRLHRLWELYLASELGFQGKDIHVGAEQMEHILTPDLEKRLTRLLENPKVDPHHQPIPGRQTL